MDGGEAELREGGSEELSGEWWVKWGEGSGDEWFEEGC